MGFDSGLGSQGALRTRPTYSTTSSLLCLVIYRMTQMYTALSRCTGHHSTENNFWFPASEAEHGSRLLT